MYKLLLIANLQIRKEGLDQGDLCPHCGMIIVMPPELEPKCMVCNRNYDE